MELSITPTPLMKSAVNVKKTSSHVIALRKKHVQKWKAA